MLMRPLLGTAVAAVDGLHCLACLVAQPAAAAAVGGVHATVADATLAISPELQNKSQQPKPSIPKEYRLQTPIKDDKSSDQTNPIVFYDIW
jgi:hypothetical protein